MLFLTLMLTGTLALGVGDILRKKYLRDGVDDQALLVISSLLIGLLLLPVLLLAGIPEIKEGFYSAVVTTILLNVVSQNLFIKAFKLSDASLIAPLRLIIPPLVIVSGLLFLNEKPSLIGATGILVTMAGLWFLLGGRKESASQGWQTRIRDKGVIYGLIGSVLFATSFPFDKIAVVQSSALFATCLIFSAVGLLTYVINAFRNRRFTATVAASLRRHFLANLSISIFSCLGFVLTNQALNYALAAYVSSLKRLQALWTVIIAGRFLQEKDMERRVVATIIMFVGILLSILWK